MASHEELIKAGSFDEKFRNALRDYYTYGFKSHQELQRMENGKLTPSVSTIHGDWTRLNNLLSDYFEWSEDKNKVFFMSGDSQSMEENPFHRVYRFCKYNSGDPITFFNVIFALSECAGLADSDRTQQILAALDIDVDDQVKRRKRVQLLEFASKHDRVALKIRGNKKMLIAHGADGRETAAMQVLKRDEVFISRILDFYDQRPGGSGNGSLRDYAATYFRDTRGYLEDQLIKLEKALQQKLPLSSSQLQCFFPGNVALFTGDNNAIQDKLDELEMLGYLKKADDDSRKLQEHHWQLETLTLQKLLDRGCKADPEFTAHFCHALDFYAKYFIFGEIGTILLSKLQSRRNSPIRMKHEYFMQALNDYNIIDLLEAMENGFWCHIRYRHGIEQTPVSLVCQPLQIRVSSTSGRQYLAYYDPFVKGYSSLRIEFMDEIRFVREGEWAQRSGRRVYLSKEKHAEYIANARSSLEHCWGSSTTAIKAGNAVRPAPLKDITVTIACNIEKEAHILNRLYRERRIGKIRVLPDRVEFSVSVTDEGELKPWLRSFYSRVLDCQGMENEAFSLKTDLAAIRYAIDEEKIPDTAAVETSRRPFRRPEILCSSLEPTAHKLLFQEYSSIYYFVIANVLTRLYSDPQHSSFSSAQIRSITEEVLGNVSGLLGKRSSRLLHSEMQGLAGLMRAGFRTVGRGGEIWYKKRPANRGNDPLEPAWKRRFQTGGEDFFRQILPMSVLERRWLLTILNDPKISLFLSREEIDALRGCICEEDPDLCPLPVECVHYTDRFDNHPTVARKETAFLSALMTAAEAGKTVQLSYRCAKGGEMEGEYAPVVLEFSKRDNLFRGYFLSVSTGEISVMNLGRMTRVRVLEKSFHLGKANQTLAAYRKRNTRKVTVEFYDRKNLADRVLSEFSPWKKRCRYDRESGLYRLTVYYQKQDALELVVRLLGYGSGIRILEKDSRIGKQYVQRIEKQIQLERGRDVSREPEAPVRNE